MYHSFPVIMQHCLALVNSPAPPVQSPPFPPQPFGAWIQIVLLTCPTRRRRWRSPSKHLAKSQFQVPNADIPLPLLPFFLISQPSAIQSCTIHTPHTCLISSRFRPPHVSNIPPFVSFAHSLIPSSWISLFKSSQSHWGSGRDVTISILIDITMCMLYYVCTVHIGILLADKQTTIKQDTLIGQDHILLQLMKCLDFSMVHLPHILVLRETMHM